MKFENTLEINRPVEMVFQFVADFENIPKWNYYVTNVKHIDGNAPGDGAVYHQVRKNDEQDYQVIQYQPNHRLSVKTLEGEKPAFERLIVFEETPRGTHIIDTLESTFRGV